MELPMIKCNFNPMWRARLSPSLIIPCHGASNCASSSGDPNSVSSTKLFLNILRPLPGRCDLELFGVVERIDLWES